MFSELQADDVDRLDSQRTVARQAASAVEGVDLQRAQLSLRSLQAVVDAAHFESHQRYELQCLGVAFGDALAADGRFHWVIITDEYGRDPTLRWKGTSLNINALTIISKRVEAGDPVDLTAIWDWAFARGAEADQREGN
jgi:hypothetical protein